MDRNNIHLITIMWRSCGCSKISAASSTREAGRCRAMHTHSTGTRVYREAPSCHVHVCFSRSICAQLKKSRHMCCIQRAMCITTQVRLHFMYPRGYSSAHPGATSESYRAVVSGTASGRVSFKDIGYILSTTQAVMLSLGDRNRNSHPACPLSV